MKTKTAISTILMALVAAASIPSQATETKDQNPAATLAAQTEQDTQASKPQAAASAPTAKKHAAQDRSKHYHPRDGK